MVRTLRFRLDVDDDTHEVLKEFQHSCSKWMNHAFKKLYSDKRHNGGALTKDLIKWKKKGSYTIDEEKMQKVVSSRSSRPTSSI